MCPLVTKMPGMAENKTKATGKSVAQFMKNVEVDRIRADSQIVLKMLQEATGAKPFMLGDTMVGFEFYRYRYESGREGDSAVIALAPRRDRITIYAAEWSPKLLTALGKYSRGKVCLHIRKLSDVNIDVLQALLVDAIAVSRVHAAKAWVEPAPQTGAAAVKKPSRKK